ncbi:MAG: hypothetical protein WCN87_02755 [Chlamydiota bacterium]
MKKILLLTLLSFSTIHAASQQGPRPKAVSDGILGAHTASIVAVSIGIVAAATGIAIIAANNSQTSHSH